MRDGPGFRGARPKNKKVQIVVAVERSEPRCRMAILRGGSANSLCPVVLAHIEPRSTVATDGWSSYQDIDRLGYLHEPDRQRAASTAGEDVGALLSGEHTHRVVGQTLVPWDSRGTLTSRAISTHSLSISTYDGRGAETSSSTGCTNSRLTTTWFASTSSNPTPSQRRRRLCHRRPGGIHRPRVTRVWRIG